ncbi:hypothetical protein [Pseudovibrio ascidiaceicola]|uniref:hypothetical protein n=1 Tax=Pseudovibrio ascidiaceicola TaxID=285279 RepID=UPI0013596D83|nr:hypothetical protein [Pseudovibrio ascidiaceicola]
MSDLINITWNKECYINATIDRYKETIDGYAFNNQEKQIIIEAYKKNLIENFDAYEQTVQKESRKLYSRRELELSFEFYNTFEGKRFLRKREKAEQTCNQAYIKWTDAAAMKSLEFRLQEVMSIYEQDYQ